MKIQHYYCPSCGHRQRHPADPNVYVCPLRQIIVQDTDFCSAHIPIETDRCDCCGGNFVFGKVCIMKEQKPDDYILDLIVCSNCSENYGKCSTCEKGPICNFETDPSPLPKVIPHQVTNGNMVMMTQIKNPERIKITCANCACYSSNECLKELHGACQQYDLHRYQG